MAGAPMSPGVKGLNCPNCGAALAMRGMGRTLSIVCIQCLSILDAADPNLKVLQQFQIKERIQPLIPLGTRGKVRGDVYEVIGFQARVLESDGIEYEWREYVLFNPYKGFRYLSEYDGHWNDIIILKAIPQETKSKGKRAVSYSGKTYLHFQSYSAQTIYVMGEFPWRAQVRDVAYLNDFVAPPQMLSSEVVENEVTWSLGEYMTGEQIWQAFSLQGPPPHPVGVYANQPAPPAKIKGIWAACLLLLTALAVMFLLSSILMRQENVFRQKYSLTARAGQEESFVTPTFELKGRSSTVELSIDTDLENDWAYFNLALINDNTGEAYDFGRQVSYYHGRDSDGNWSEGSRRDSVLIPSVPAGRYYLRVEPEMDDNTTASLRPGVRTVNYELGLRRDIPNNTFFWIAAVLLLVPPVFKLIGAGSFERARWAQSDYAASSSGDDDE
jgi:hypothetical protein